MAAILVMAGAAVGAGSLPFGSPGKLTRKLLPRLPAALVVGMLALHNTSQSHRPKNT